MDHVDIFAKNRERRLLNPNTPRHRTTPHIQHSTSSDFADQQGEPPSEQGGCAGTAGIGRGRNRGEGGLGCTSFMHSCSLNTIGPRILILPGRSTSAFHRPGRHRVHQARTAVRYSASRNAGDGVFISCTAVVWAGWGGVVEAPTS